MKSTTEIAEWVDAAKAANSPLNYEGLCLEDTWVSFAHRYFYMGIPKSACSKIKMVLHQLEGYALPENPFDVHARSTPGQRFVPSLADLSTGDAVEVLTSPDWFRFSFVRNPYLRLLSGYKSQVLDLGSGYVGFRESIREMAGYSTREGEEPGMVAFRDFVNYIDRQADDERDGHWRSQTGTLCLDSIRYDIVGRVERFETDFANVTRLFTGDDALESTLGEVVNPSLPVPLAVAYDVEFARKVYAMYREDFETFGYHQNSWRLADI